MPATLPPWLRASNAPAIYAEGLPAGFKLGMASEQFAKELELKRAQREDELLKTGANLSMTAGSQANAMAMNVANLRWQQEKNAQDMQLSWQKEMDDLARQQATLDEAARRTDLEHVLSQQRLQQEAMQSSHRLAIEKEYKNSEIALNRQSLLGKQFELDQKTQDAARRSAAILAYQNELDQAQTEEDRLAVARKYLPQIGATPSATTTLFRQKAALPRSFYTVENYPGADGTQHSFLIRRSEDGSALSAHPMGPGQKPPRLNQIELEKSRQAIARSNEAKANLKNLETAPKPSSQRDIKAREEALAKARKEVADIDAEIKVYEDKLGSVAGFDKAPFAEGTVVTNSKTGEAFIVKGGRLVPVNVETK